jgi:hypothetical protein
MQADGAARMTTSPNSTPDRSAQSARRDPFLALANEIERNPWWANSGEWDLPPEKENRRQRRVSVRPPDGLRTPAEAARKPRRPPLDTLLKQAAKADKSVKGAEVYPDRTVLQFGEPEPAAPDDPWPLDEFRTKETKQ